MSGSQALQSMAHPASVLQSQAPQVLEAASVFIAKQRELLEQFSKVASLAAAEAHAQQAEAAPAPGLDGSQGDQDMQIDGEQSVQQGLEYAKAKYGEQFGEQPAFKRALEDVIQHVCKRQRLG